MLDRIRAFLLSLFKAIKKVIGAAWLWLWHTRPGALARRLPMPVFLLVLALLIFSLLVATKPQTKPVEGRERVWAVKTQTVEYITTTPHISAFGELRAHRQVDLRAMVAGEVLVTGDNFEDGARVKKGETLVEIDPFNYRAAVNDAKAQLTGSKALLTERQAGANQARLELQRAEKLFKKGTVSKKTLDDKRTDYTIKKARRTQQQSVVERHLVKLERVERDLHNTKVVAPFNAYVSKIAAREGRVLNLNDRVASLSGADEYEVVFNLSDEQYGRFLMRNAEIIGSALDVYWDIGGERLALKAVIERVGAQISQSTRGVDVFARIDGAIPSNLRSGAFVTISLAAEPIDNVVSIPKDAVYGQGQVYLVENGRLQSTPLDDFIDLGDRLLVRSGLETGQTILLTRFNEAASGVAVKVLEAP